MPKRPKDGPPTKLIQDWQLSSAATLGSAVRAEGILLEVRARLPLADRTFVELEACKLALRVPVTYDDDYWALAESVSRALDGIEALPVIPREVEDILSISSAERHRWLKDGRLKSAGTRTVKLRGRARKITFHVFDPRHIEDLLDRNMPEVWREEDALAKAENRRRAAGKAALTRAGKNARKTAATSGAARDDGPAIRLEGWEDFDLDGLLR